MFRLLAAMILTLALPSLLPGDVAGDEAAETADVASGEVLVDEVLLGRALSLRVYMKRVDSPPSTGRRVTANPRLFPTARYHGEVRIVVFDSHQQAERAANRYRTHHEREGWEARVVLAEWARDDSLVVLFTAGSDVILNRFALSDEPHVEGRRLFERGQRVPDVWEVVRAELVDRPDEGEKLVVNVTVRKYDGSLIHIPVERDLTELNARWRFDTRLIGTMEADAVIDWEWLAQEQRKRE